MLRRRHILPSLALSVAAAMIAACAQTPQDVRAERIARLESIATDCGLPATRVEPQHRADMTRLRFVQRDFRAFK